MFEYYKICKILNTQNLENKATFHQSAKDSLKLTVNKNR